MKEIDKLVSAAKALGEKGMEVDPASVVAFGMRLSTRYGKCRELAELLTFAHEAALRAVSQYVAEVSYDTKSCCAFFTLNDPVPPDAMDELHAAAKKTIEQFELGDFGVDGKGFPDN